MTKPSTKITKMTEYIRNTLVFLLFVSLECFVGPYAQSLSNTGKRMGTKKEKVELQIFCVPQF